MKLNKKNIKGTMKDYKSKSLMVAEIVLTVGVVAFSTHMIDLSRENDSKLDHYSSYTEQIESLYNVDISSVKKEEILDSMAFNLDLVNRYNATTDSSKKEKIVQQIYNTKGMLKNRVFSLIKLDAALEEGRDPKEYAIRPGTDCEWEVYREADGITQFHSGLNYSACKLVNIAEDLDSVSKEDTKELLKLYEGTVKQAAVYVGKTAQDKAK